MTFALAALNRRRWGHGRLTAMTLLLAILATAVLLALPSAAAAEERFCLPGTGAGQCGERPEGIAVSDTSGDVYVVDRGNNRVNVFTAEREFRFAWGYGVADGTTAALQRCGPEATPPSATCFPGIEGSGPGQFKFPTQIAIDNDPASSSYGSVYVGTDNFRVQKFDAEGNYLLVFGSQGSGPGQFGGTSNPIAVAGTDGSIYVGDSGPTGPRVEKFSSTGSFIGEVELPEPESSFEALAVDSGGDLFASFGAFEDIGIWKYEWAEPTAVKLIRFDFSPVTIPRARSLTMSDDDLFAFQFIGSPTTGADLRVITRFDLDGSILSRFGYGEIPSSLSEGMAANAGTGDVYGLETELNNQKAIHLTVPEPGPIVATTKAAPVGNAKATLRAEVNPEGKSSSYHFEYVDQEAFEDTGFTGPKVKSTLESAPFGSAGDFDLHEVSAVIGCANPVSEAGSGKCLIPNTAYRFRIVTKNADGEDEAEGSFTTRPPLEIVATWATEVGTDAARLHAEVNPLGIPTTGYFQYVDEETFHVSGFEEAIGVPDVGSGKDPLSFGSGEAPVTRSVQLHSLAPGTAYRYRVLVTDPLLSEPVASLEHAFTAFAPPSAPNAECPNQIFRTGASASLPDCRAYEMVTPLEKANGDVISAPNIQAHPAGFDQSAISGGKLTYSTYRPFDDAVSAPYTSQHIATRGEHGWSSHPISPARGINLLGSGETLERQFSVFSPDLCQGWLLHDTNPPLAPGAVEDYANLYRRENCGEEGYTAITTVKPPGVDAFHFLPDLQGLSADGSAAFFRAEGKLTPNAASGRPLVYESSGGVLRLVCLLPGGAVSKEGCAVGTSNGTDGRSDMAFNAISTDGSRVFWTSQVGVPGQIYVRIEGKTTVAVSESVSKAAARFWGASANGSKAIFTIEDGNASPGDELYEFDVDNEEERLIAAETEGVLGMSEDASRVYFVSREDLDEGATAGKPNLYLHEAGEASPRYVASLAEVDAEQMTGEGVLTPVNAKSISHAARVSPDGLHAAFMSWGSPTGYDNADAVSGEPDAEVYVYDAVANRLDCASCNPSGGRPMGSDLLSPIRLPTGLWAAALLPGAQGNLYSSRVLSDDGNRLFFESHDALVLRDTNGKLDVYQWEAAGSGDCGEESATFSPSNGGCIALISSGQSPQDTRFVDASPTGDDVFIRTNASLLPEDYGLVDIYDARAGGGYPPPQIPPPACEGEACQGPVSAPDDPTPASSAFEGAGNVVEAPRPAKCAKGRRAVRKAGKTRCLKKPQRAKRQKHRNRRAAR